MKMPCAAGTRFLAISTPFRAGTLVANVTKDKCKSPIAVTQRICKA
jgi:hypothetical protein